MLKFLVIGILEDYSIVINKRINILVGRNSEFIRNTFGLTAGLIISKTDRMTASVGTIDRKSSIIIQFIRLP